MTTGPKLSPAEARALVDASENRLRDRVVDAVAEVVGREEAERLARAVYATEPPSQQLTPFELSRLRRAAARGKKEAKRKDFPREKVPGKGPGRRFGL